MKHYKPVSTKLGTLHSVGNRWPTNGPIPRYFLNILGLFTTAVSNHANEKNLPLTLDCVSNKDELNENFYQIFIGLSDLWRNYLQCSDSVNNVKSNDKKSGQKERESVVLSDKIKKTCGVATTRLASCFVGSLFKPYLNYIMYAV